MLMQMNHSALQVLGTVVAVQALCLISGAYILRPEIIPGESSVPGSLIRSINTLEDELIQTSLVSRFQNPSIAPVLVEQALTSLVQQELHAYVRGQPSIPPDPAERLSEEVRERAFHAIESQIDDAISAGEWSEADTTAIMPHLASITDKQRTALADKVNRAIAERRMKPGGVPPPL